MAKTTIANSNWDYTLTQNEAGEYFFEVVCGTVAIYTIEFKLNAEEVLNWQHEGELALNHLAYRVRDYPDEYLARQEKN